MGTVREEAVKEGTVLTARTLKDTIKEVSGREPALEEVGFRLSYARYDGKYFLEVQFRSSDVQPSIVITGWSPDRDLRSPNDWLATFNAFFDERDIPQLIGIASFVLAWIQDPKVEDEDS